MRDSAWCNGTDVTEVNFGSQKHSDITIRHQELELLQLRFGPASSGKHLLTYKELLHSLLYLATAQFWGHHTLVQGFTYSIYPNIWRACTVLLSVNVARQSLTLQLPLPVLLVWLMNTASVWYSSSPLISLPLTPGLWRRRKLLSATVRSDAGTTESYMWSHAVLVSVCNCT